MDNDDEKKSQDFDFANNTLKFTENLPEEEKVLHHRNKPHEPQATQHGESGLSWNNAENNHIDHRLPTHPILGDSSSPSTAAASIWGNFANNESFGAMNHGNASPFARHQQLGYGSPLPNMSPSNSMGVLPPQHHQQQQQQRQHRSLEEIEAELHRGQYRQSFGDDTRKKMLSLAEVEAAMLQGSHNNNNNMMPGGGGPGGGMNAREAALFQQLQQQQHHQHQQQLMQQQQQQLLQLRQQQQQQQQQHDPNLPFNFAQPDSPHLLALRQQQELMEQMSIEREMKRREDMRKSQYDNLMTQHDKDFIQRIQLTQLASGDPYADDFYFQVYSSLRMRAAGINNNNANKPASNGTRNGRGRREDNMMQRMQMQIQRIVNDAKRRPKQTQVTLEGALGKITTLSTRNPRQTLQVTEKKPTQDGDPVSPKSTDDHTQSIHPKSKKGNSLNDRRRIMNIVESLYYKVLELEQMRRQGPPRSRHNDDEEQEQKVNEWNEQYESKVEQLWKALKLMETDEVENNTTLIVSVIGINKGKKLIPRITRTLSADQNLTMLSVIISNFSQLQISQHVIYPGTQVVNIEEAQHHYRFVPFEDVELFMNASAPSLLSFITEAPMQVVVGLTRLFLEKNDIGFIVQSKPGLAFLTMLLSRAEILKNGGGALNRSAPPSAEDLSLWQDVYTRFFNALQGRFNSIFPALYYLAPINPTVDLVQISLSIDDMYIWQFLAAVAVGATMEQQHILVTEVRDRVMENIILAKSNRLPLEHATHRIDNINLFLHSLGLDASQVSVPL
ncbi:unnamed protein product [Cunninghamella echinulata]